jgi:hypothetical protein
MKNRERACEGRNTLGTAWKSAPQPCSEVKETLNPGLLSWTLKAWTHTTEVVGFAVEVWIGL